LAAVSPPPTVSWQVAAIPRILTGEDGMEEALVRQNVKFVILRARGEDVPDAHRSRAVIAAHRHFLLMFQNEDVVIFGARPR